MKNDFALGIVVLFIVLAVGALSISVYGAILAFRVSIILGILALVVEPSPFIFGIVALFGVNVPNIIQAWIKFPI